MRKFDEACLTPVRPLTPEEIRALREREGASQTVAVSKKRTGRPVRFTVSKQSCRHYAIAWKAIHQRVDMVPWQCVPDRHLRMSGDEAHAVFKAIRWANNVGEPFCPRCEYTEIYTFNPGTLWKCQACGYQFSATSRTIFACWKPPIRNCLATICIFLNAVKDILSSLICNRLFQCLNHRIPNHLSHLRNLSKSFR